MDIVNKKISQSDWQCTGEDHRENSNNCSDLIIIPELVLAHFSLIAPYLH